MKKHSREDEKFGKDKRPRHNSREFDEDTYRQNVEIYSQTYPPGSIEKVSEKDIQDDNLEKGVRYLICRPDMSVHHASSAMFSTGVFESGTGNKYGILKFTDIENLHQDPGIYSGLIPETELTITKRHLILYRIHPSLPDNVLRYIESQRSGKEPSIPKKIAKKGGSFYINKSNKKSSKKKLKQIKKSRKIKK